MKRIRYFLLGLLTGRTALVPNTDIRSAGAGCHPEFRIVDDGGVYLKGCTLRPLD